MALLTSDRQIQIDNAIEDIKLRSGMSYPENGLLDIVKAFNITTLEMDFSKFPTVKGVVQYKNKQGDPDPKIFINKDLPPEGKTFTLAHELGHYFLHPNEDKLRIDHFDYSQQTKESLEESEANYFAASLLVPKEKLLKTLSLTNDIGVVASYFGVSKPVIETRIQWIKKNSH